MELTNNAEYFLQHAKPTVTAEQIDLRTGDGWYDDLAYPVVRLRSTMSWGERARVHGVSGLDPSRAAKKLSNGAFLPTDQHIADVERCYGVMYETRMVELGPYKRFGIAGALDRAGRDLRDLVDRGGFQIV